MSRALTQADFIKAKELLNVLIRDVGNQYVVRFDFPKNEYNPFKVTLLYTFDFNSSDVFRISGLHYYDVDTVRLLNEGVEQLKVELIERIKEAWLNCIIR